MDYEKLLLKQKMLAEAFSVFMCLAAGYKTSCHGYLPLYSTVCTVPLYSTCCTTSHLDVCHRGSCI